MKIPLVDLQAQYAAIKPEIDAALQGVIEKCAFIMGEPVKSFEAAFAEYCRAQYCIGASSGTTALHLALVVWGIGPGDEVITAPNSFIATAEAISHCGAKPVFADIEPETYTLDPATVAKAVTPRTKAIIPVHLYGHPADMDPINDIARTHNLKVLEDAAQARGAEYKGRRSGTLGDAAAFSFFPGKNLGAYGDGGALVTNDEKIAARARLLANHGREAKYEHKLVGFNYRLDALQAAVLSVKLKHLEAWTERRRQLAAYYDKLLTEAGIAPPQQASWARHVYHLYVVRVKNRDKVMEKMQAGGVSCGVHYPLPLHLQPAYADLGYHQGDFPTTEAAAAEVLSLPIYPEMTEDLVNTVVDLLRQNLSP
jgi:dTDP-4-amino-4,6-dideoxygalactose transaminase